MDLEDVAQGVPMVDIIDIVPNLALKSSATAAANSLRALMYFLLPPFH